MLKINIFNQYNEDKNYTKIINKILKSAFKFLKYKEKMIVNVILLDNETIKEMNKNYRNLDKETDVLSFENDGYTAEIGDIFISIDKVKEQATSYNHDFARELAFLSVHGFLHCLGYDHLNKENELEMFTLQDRILEISKYRRT
ncbi:MAG: rRNA maturation RNase YbeY [Candidatus Izemoplasmatales bacterium]|nr:rRNA maturation RNase YbeY [Candidatus Izemoplasmatales bacterium]